jgi:tetratricopeptide (TPR) repeat protein
MAFAGTPSSAHAQSKDAFADAIVTVARALQGEQGGNSVQIDAALEGAALALEHWDASLAAFERRIEAEAATSSSDEAQLRTSFGALLIERGRIDDGLRELGRATALDPTLGSAWLLKGLAGELTGHDDLARQAFFAAFANAPSDPVAAYHVVRLSKDGSPERLAAMRVLVVAHVRSLTGPQGGRAPFIHMPLLEEARVADPLFLPHWYAPVLPLLAQRRYDAVVGTLRARWRLDPLRNDPAMSSGSWAEAARLLDDGRPAAALALLDGEPALTSASEAHRLRAAAHRAAGRHAVAREALERAVAVGPWNERAVLALAGLLHDTGDAPAAERVLDEARTRFPESAAIAWRQADVYASLGRDPDVMQALEATSRIGPFAGSSQLWWMVGRLRSQASNVDGAEVAFRHQLALAPNDAQTHADLADFLRGQERTDEALAEYVAVALINPGHFTAHTSIGQMHLEAGRAAEAADVLQFVIARRPDYVEARYALATAFFRLQRTQDGQRELEAFRELQTTHVASSRRWYQLATLQTDARMREAGGQLEDALVLRQRLIDAEPQVALNYQNLAETLIRLGRLELATQALERAASLGGSPVVYRRLAELYARLGQSEKSAKALGQFEATRQDGLRTRGLAR